MVNAGVRRRNLSVGESVQVYSLSVDGFQWKEHTSEVDGDYPSPRGGHSAAALPVNPFHHICQDFHVMLHSLPCLPPFLFGEVPHLLGDSCLHDCGTASMWADCGAAAGILQSTESRTACHVVCGNQCRACVAAKTLRLMMTSASLSSMAVGGQ